MHRITRPLAVCCALTAGLILVAPGIASAEPAATASATTDLVDGQTVTVDYSGFPAGATIAVVQCTAAPPASNAECDEEGFELGSADPNGAGTVEFTLHTGTIGSDGTTCDGAENNDCAIVVTDFPVTVSAVVPISFAADAATVEDTTTSTTEADATTTTAADGEGEDAPDAADVEGDDDGSSAVVPIVIGLVVLAAAGAAVLLVRRRRS